MYYCSLQRDNMNQANKITKVKCIDCEHICYQTYGKEKKWCDLTGVEIFEGCDDFEEKKLTSERKKLVHSGSSYYVECPRCEKVHWLMWENIGTKVFCRRCKVWYEIIERK